MGKLSLNFLVAFFVVVWTCDAIAFELKGFGDVSYERTSGSSEEKDNRDSFILGNLDLYISEQIDDRLDVLGEIVVDSEEEKIDIERFHIGYIFSDAIKIRGGRFHTPLGFWNISFHHGAQLQPTIDRPEILKFDDEGGVLPTHTVGINATGRFKAGLSVFNYDLIIGNGSRIKATDGGGGILFPNPKSDDNNNKAVVLSLSIKPGMVPGLKVGIAGDIQRVQSEKGVAVDVDTDQTIIVPSFLYHRDNLELWGEYFSIRNKDRKGIVGTKTGSGYYLLLTYNLNEQWMPYALIEQRNVESGDNYFEALGVKNIDEAIAGLRYNISYRSCIKVEGRAVKEGNDHYDEYATQWAISF